MIHKILKSKIQELVVTESKIEYPGSISLPKELLVAANIKPFELVHVNNKTNGNRITTYAVENKLNGTVTVNGAASHLFNRGDQIHVLSFGYLSEEELELHQPRIIITNSSNAILEDKPYKL